jgi:UPF0716 protein FxsA
MKLIVSLAVLFVVVPILEFTILIEMGRRIGTIYTIIIVLGAGIAGAILAKMEGLRIVAKIQDNLRAGTMPTEQLFDGLLVLIAGVLLLTPGLLSDCLGLVFLFPPTRYPIKLALRRMTRNWIVSRTLRISV